MGKGILDTLARNLNRLIGPGLYYASNEATAEKSKIGRSTIDRARKAEVGLRVDNLEQLAGAFKLEPWQLLIEGFDPSHPPMLEKQNSLSPTLRPSEKKLLSVFRALREPERTYLVKQAETYLQAQQELDGAAGHDSTKKSGPSPRKAAGF